jgi:hypothetical protein
VTSLQSKYPARASELETRYNNRITAAAQLELQNLQMAQRLRTLERDNASLTADVRRLATLQDGLQQALKAQALEDKSGKTPDIQEAFDIRVAQMKAKAAEEAQKKAEGKEKDDKTTINTLRGEVNDLKNRLQRGWVLCQEAATQWQEALAKKGGASAEAKAKIDKAASEFLGPGWQSRRSVFDK